jgi:DNA-binding response OmpR family regulator
MYDPVSVDNSRKRLPVPAPSFVSSDPRLSNVLIVDGESVTAGYIPLFSGERFRVNATPHVPVALEYIRRAAPPLVVTELALLDGSGLDVCTTAKALSVPSTVLVTTTDPAKVPDALAAGCDGVLLKPFAPNLLISRISRLLRDRSTRIRLQSARSLGKAAHLSERIDLLKTGTNRSWPNTQCPYCSHSGVTSFDYASMRRAWYACLACRKVWMAKRQE